ncbi:MAG: hypothetical protein ACLRPV_07030 [Lacrimispora saccharolytica]
MRPFDSTILYELCPELLDLPGCDFPVGTVEKSDAEYQGRQPGFHGGKHDVKEINDLCDGFEEMLSGWKENAER